VLKKAFEGGFLITNEELRITEAITNEELRITETIKNEELRITNEENYSNHNNQINHSSDNLPKGWKWVKLGEEFDFIGGGTPSKQNSDYWNGDLFWCSVKDVKGDYLHKTIDRITRKGLNESASNLAQPEEVILITRISPGKTIISKVETAINQDLKVVKPKREYLPKLIHYLFQAYERDVIKLSSGTTVLGINLTNLKSIEIPFLTIEEQTQIVQEIESRLSVTDNLEFVIRNSIEKAEALRQSILKKAFEGKLLSQAEIEQCKQAADYEPASELLKKIQAEKLATLRQAQDAKKKKPTVKKKSKK